MVSGRGGRGNRALRAVASTNARLFPLSQLFDLVKVGVGAVLVALELIRHAPALERLGVSG